MDGRPTWEELREECDPGCLARERKERAAEKLHNALKVAMPYVIAFAENAPEDDGGAEAKADLEIIVAALAAAEQ